MTLIARATALARPLILGLETLQPALDLLVRLWVAKVFFVSGLTKIATWDTTVALFTYEYEVPLLSPGIAALLGTFTELAFPVLLAIGLGGRFSAGVLFAFNIIAVISYPGLNEVGLKDHQYWGVMLLLPLLHGPGKLSIDHLLRRRFMP